MARTAGTSPRPAGQGFLPDDDAPVFVISVAAQLAGMHAQTLRQYDRLGLVSPSRTRGGGRRYSARDVTVLREVQRLSQEHGVSLAGIRHILQLQREVAELRERVSALSAELDVVRGEAGHRIFAAGLAGEIVAVRPGERPPRGLGQSQAVVVWRPR